MSPLAIFLAFFSLVEASEIRFDLKDGAFLSRTILEDKSYSFFKTQLRFELTQELGSRFKFHGEPQALFYGGGYLQEVEWTNFVAPLLEGKSNLDWEKRWAWQDNKELRARLYRGHLGYTQESLEILAGRLRHGLGNTRIFLSPLDRLDDLATFVSEDLERPGSDSFLIKGGLGERVSFKSGYIWADQGNRFRGYAQGRFLAHEGLELEVLLGRLEPRTNGIGFGIQKSIAEGELKWETTQNQREFEKTIVTFIGLLPQIQTQTQKQNFSRHNLSWEKSYARDLTLDLEYFHNGRGAKKTQDYDFASLLRGEDYYLARDYGGFLIKKTLSPLWSIRLQGMSNIHDKSLGWYPEISFTSAGMSIEVVLKSAFFFGRDAAEFGRLPNRIQGALTIYF